MTPFLLSGPTIEPVSLAEAKAWLKLDTNEEDDLVGALVTSARLVVESVTRRLILTQAWRFVLDEWPPGKNIDIPFAPFQSLTAIRVYDAANAVQTLAPALYRVEAAPERARVAFAEAPAAPGRASAGIEIDVVFGYGDAPASAPAPLRQAIKLLAARWFEDRGDAFADPAGAQLPAAVAALVGPYRRARLA